MKWYLVKFKKNWADEFNVEGFFLATEEEYNLATKIIGEIGDKNTFRYYFGTNEGWGEYDEETIKEVWDNNYIATPIDDTDMIYETIIIDMIYETFLKESTFGSFGVVPTFSDLFEDIEHPLVTEYWDRYSKEFKTKNILN